MSADFLLDPDDFRYTTRSTATRLLAGLESTREFSEVGKLTKILDEWEDQHSTANYDPIPALTGLAEIIEAATDDFLKQDPDPLDDRHPHRTHPHLAFGNLLKTLFKNDHFMSKLIISYILDKRNPDLNVAAARLLLDCVPGLDPAVIFAEPENFIPEIYLWVNTHPSETMRAYSVGLLSSVLEVQEFASKYRAYNFQLIPVALKKLVELKDKMIAEREAAEQVATASSSSLSLHNDGPFANVSLHDETSKSNSNDGLPNNDDTARPSSMNNVQQLGGSHQPMRVRPPVPINGDPCNSPPRKRRRSTKERGMIAVPSFGSLQDLENSNSCWNRVQPYVIGNHKVYPLSLEMHQRLLLQFLGPTGEYQDLLSLAYEGNAMDLLLFYIDLEKTRDVRLTFDALRYLTSLLVHRKFALEFISRGGVQALVKVPRGSMASVGAATCLYYLAYNQDVMEKVCLLEDKVLDELVDYCLWCLEHSYESGMASGAMFFTHSFFYKAILHRFDARDGLRKLYNYASTLSLLQDSSSTEQLSEEQLHTSTQSVRNACAAFRSYVCAHLYAKLEVLKKTCKGLTQLLSLPVETIPPHKTLDLGDECLEPAVQVMTKILRVSSSGWRHIEDARRLGVFTTMFNILEYAQEWVQVCGMSELIRNAVETLWIGSAHMKVQAEFCEIVRGSVMKVDGFCILVKIAEADWYEEDSVQTHALRVITNSCQSAGDHRERKGSFKFDTKKIKTMDLNDHQKAIWNTLRKHNIIMILNSVIRQTTPTSEADKIRDYGCRAMLALARSEDVRQILFKLPLIANNELQGLMKQPVAEEQKADHNRFCKAAKELIETVTQRPIKDNIPDPRDLTQERLWKSHVVANTRVTYNEKELLQLIHGHLTKSGLTDTAAQLIKEAELPDVPASRVSNTPAKLQPFPRVLDWETPPSRSRRSLLMGTPCSSRVPSLYNDTPTSPVNGDGGLFKKPSAKTPMSNKRLCLRTPTSRPSFIQNQKRIQPFKGLDDIVTDYFRTQHSHCSNPVTTCPPFSLFYPHHCPEPRSSGIIPYNIVKRFNERPIRRSHQLQRTLNFDERYAFSRFRPSRTLSDQEEMYTTSAFSIDDEHLIVGMFSGDVYFINVETGTEDAHTMCHSSGVTAIFPSKDGSMLLTSSAFIRPLSSLWRLGETQELLYYLPHEHAVKFSNLTNDKIIGTSDEYGKATVFDTETGHPVMVFKENLEHLSGSRYQHNKASFSPCDTMILNEGMLWDVRDSTKCIHSFDKLNPTIGGIFHPHGREVIINTEVWDMRTLRLLHTVPALDQCEIRFNSTGNIMYATAYVDSEDVFRQYGASFRTIDSIDYSVIATVDTKKNLLDLSCSNGDQYLALIERRAGSEYMEQEQSIVRMYEVGKRRDLEDDLDEGEEENDDGGDGRLDESDSMSDMEGSESMSGESMDIFRAIRGAEDVSGSEDELDSSLTEEDDEEDDLGGSNSSDSSGWETASNEDGDDDEPPAEGDFEENGDADDDDDEEEESDDNDMDDTYNPPDGENQHPSTSNVALNPHVRRQKRRHSGSGR